MARPDTLARTVPAVLPETAVRARHGQGNRIDGPDALRSCLTMLASTVRACDPDRSAAGSDRHLADTTPDPGAPPLNALKVQAEAAMLLGAAARTGTLGRENAGVVADLAEALLPCRDRSAAVRLCLHPSAALDLAVVHLHLRRAGYPDRQWDLLLHEMLDGARIPGPERLPHRELEQDWLLGMWNDDTRSGTAGEVPAACALARPLDALNCTVDDLYELTHAALYATDLGHRAVELPRPEPDIIADVEVGLAIALDGRNLDIATELLWLHPMLQLPWSPAARFAWREVLGSYLTFGFVPGPGFDRSRHAALPPGLAAEYAQRSSYHANVAFGIQLCALSTTDQQPADIADLPDRPPDSLAIVTRLRRARAAHDLPALRRALAEAVDLGVADRPAPRQAAALLRRAALVVG